ncbi:MAG: FkbM family methyltransferase [Pseudomonadota bacterium]
MRHHGIDVIFDVGANVGQYASKLRRIGFDGPIVSFEPLVSVHRDLEAAAADDPDWVVAPPMALGAEDGTITINRSAETDMSSALEFNAEMAKLLSSSAHVAQETVPQRRLDGLFAEYVSSDQKPMLKIDTQGFERQVLDGATGVLDQLALIQLELSIIEIYEGEPTWRDMVSHLESLGFEPVLFIPGYFNKRTSRLLQMDGVFARP